MPSSAAVIDSLAVSCVMLACALFVGWYRYVREAYVATLAAAFAALAIGHVAAFAALSSTANPAVALSIGAAAKIAGLAALAIGFRLRAGCPAARARMAASAAAGLATCIWSVTIGRPLGVAMALTCYAAFATVLSARALVGGAVAGRAKGGPAYWMFVIFVGYLGLQFVLLAAIPSMAPRHRVMVEFLTVTGWAGGLVGIGLFAILLIVEDLASKLNRLALVDPLTNVLNRRGIDRTAAPLVATAFRRGEKLALIAADLDRFKAVNDRFGHALGDRVLERFASHLQRMRRPGDLVGRLGGEEFVVVMRGAGAVEAHAAIEELRTSLAGAFADLGLPMPITASYGIAAYQPGDSLDSLLIRADRALYGAKLDGRDRVILAEPDRPATDERFRIAWTKQDVAPVVRHGNEPIAGASSAR